MSKLQDFVNKLVDVVISYRQTQKPYLTEAETKNIPESDLTSILHRWICNMSYAERKSLMHFFIYVIEQVKPLVDKPEPLSVEEQQTTQDILVHLLTTNADLLKHNQNSLPLSITYGGTKKEMPGFIRRGITGYTYYCNSGQIIRNTLFESKDLAELTETSNFQDIINGLINEHQQPLIEAAQKEKKMKALENDLETETNKSRMLEEQNTALTARLLIAEKTTAELQQSNHSLTQQIAVLQQSNHSLTQQIAVLKKTDSDGIALSSSLVQGKTNDLLEESRPSMTNIAAGRPFWASSVLLNALHPIRINKNDEDKSIKKTF